MSQDGMTKNIFKEEDLNFDESVLSDGKEVSFVGEEESGDFVVTLDLTKFDSLIDIVKKVLLVKGYVVNLENLLSVLDQFQIGVRAAVHSQEPPFKVSSYNYCFKLSKPNPQIQGDLIKVFYSEVSKYQKEIINLKSDLETLEAKNKTQTIRELRDEIKRLQSENSQLIEKNNTLNKKIENSINSIKTAGKQEKAWPLEEGELRLAKVKSLDLMSKQLSLRSVGSSFYFNLSKLEEIPDIGSTCLVHVIDGTIQKLFSLGGKTKSFNLSLSTVLIYSKEGLKVRDADRNILIIRLETGDDYRRAEGLCRGMPILLYKFQGKIIKWATLKEYNQELALKMEETVFRYHYQNWKTYERTTKE